MRILMVLDHNFPTDQRVEKEVDSLVKNGHKIILACFSFQRTEPLFENKGNITIYRKPISTLQHKSSVAALKLPLYFSFWRRFISNILKKEEIDAIHIHDLPLAKVGVYFKKKLNIPLVIDLHENWPASLEKAIHTNTLLGKILSSNKQWRDYEKNILKHADAIITVIVEMRNRIENLGIDKTKLYVVSNSINPSDFPLHENKPDKNFTTLFYAGGLNIHRGLHIVIKAISLIAEKMPNIRLLIAGKGSYQNELEKLTTDLNIEDNIKFMGYQTLDEMSKLLAESDIALIPHVKWEQTDCSSPNKLYQYIYAKKPILTSNCDSLTRLVNETKSGISYIHDSPEDFKKAFFKVLDSQNNTIDLDFALETINTKYNWSVDSVNLIQVYKDLNNENTSNRIMP